MTQDPLLPKSNVCVVFSWTGSTFESEQAEKSTSAGHCLSPGSSPINIISQGHTTFC